MHNHQQSRAHRKMVEELQAEFGDDVLGGLEEGEDKKGEELDDPDLRAFEAVEAEAAAAAAAAALAVGEGGGDGQVEVEGEGQDDGGEEEVERDKEEEAEEEGESSEEDEDVGQVSRGVNRFAFGDDSSSEDGG